MIILDTNVLSETLRPIPSTTVLEWMRSEPALALFTTAITEAELLYGTASFPWPAADALATVSHRGGFVRITGGLEARPPVGSRDG